ncbi:uncharacterized protein K444DRAFT_235732 [Hyaloscypha bicolor E]|uniref:Uncharacterized protein n=1 Tax=Hyaloscypha bicolor E TaxID=1095630 RepID=A0A2J6SLJ0_9HELO|nr:uncharacterized protein K444DRAFT_235732 [Hyaloscypha bicolor E]PMD51643.1 hypothetical protein K444DRAFT_235732 [Hyaloscypha bicolor E]
MVCGHTMRSVSPLPIHIPKAIAGEPCVFLSPTSSQFPQPRPQLLSAPLPSRPIPPPPSVPRASPRRSPRSGRRSSSWLELGACLSFGEDEVRIALLGMEMRR